MIREDEFSRFSLPVASLLQKFIADERGELEFEVRFGKIVRHHKGLFKTGVRREWLDAVEDFLKNDQWLLANESLFKQYKLGQKRMRVFSDGNKETVKKKTMVNLTMRLSRKSDMRVSLSREKERAPLRIEGRLHELVFRKTYTRGVFRFDLTKTKKQRNKGITWEYRVELEVDRSLRSQLSASSLETELYAIIDQIALI